MDIKDLKYNAAGTVDMQIFHPTYRWIPFTASPDDVMPHGKVIYQEVVTGKYGSIKAYNDTQAT